MQGETLPPVSQRLQDFIDQAPAVRGPHLPFLRKAAASLSSGERVLDVGAGDAPYRELFDGLDYLTCDWADSEYRPEVPPDIVASADAIGLPDGSVDAIVCTQALEHMPEPWRVLEEFHRLLRPGGGLWVTTPFVWYLHEVPHDYYRYTSYGLSYLMTRAGFADVEVLPMNNSMATIAQLLEQLVHIIGPSDDGYDAMRTMAGALLAKLAPAVESYGHMDSRWLLPLSFQARATRPA